MITQLGAINTTALIVPGILVQIVPPQNVLLNGLPTNVLGVVGTANWGPVNAPTIIGDMRAYAAQFGPIQARKYDMGTAVAAAVLQGANNFRCARVTDGSDTAASATITSSGTAITLTPARSRTARSSRSATARRAGVSRQASRSPAS